MTPAGKTFLYLLTDMSKTTHIPGRKNAPISQQITIFYCSRCYALSFCFLFPRINWNLNGSCPFSTTNFDLITLPSLLIDRSSKKIWYFAILNWGSGERNYWITLVWTLVHWSMTSYEISIHGRLHWELLLVSVTSLFSLLLSSDNILLTWDEI